MYLPTSLLGGATVRGVVAVALAGAIVATGAMPAWAGSSAPGGARSAAAVPGQNPAGRAGSIAHRSIPDAAMLQPQDLHGATPTPVTDDYWAALQPPQPCADRPYPSAGLQVADRAITALIGVDRGPTVVMEHVATYRSDGAHQYLQQLRRALAACNGLDNDGVLWTVRATGVAGDESVLLSSRTYIDYADSYHYTYLVVARVGKALVVVADTGWETASGDEALARELGVAGARRAAVLK